MGLVFLTGMTGAGKTTVGRALAARLGVPFLDADEEIETRAGCSIEQLFQEQGEDEARRMEGEVVEALAGRNEGVIALGAGALERLRSFLKVRQSGVLVYLRIPSDLLVIRLWPPAGRPLLAGVGTPEELKLRLSDMLARREPRYLAAGIVIDINADQAPAALADQILRELATL